MVFKPNFSQPAQLDFCSQTFLHLSRLLWCVTRPLPWCTLISWPGERSLLRLSFPLRLFWLAAWLWCQEAERVIGCWIPAPPGGSPGRRGWAWCWGPHRDLQPVSAGCWWTAGQHTRTPSDYKRCKRRLLIRGGHLYNLDGLLDHRRSSCWHFAHHALWGNTKPD